MFSGKLSSWMSVYECWTEYGISYKSCLCFSMTEKLRGMDRKLGFPNSGKDLLTHS